MKHALYYSFLNMARLCSIQSLEKSNVYDSVIGMSQMKKSHRRVTSTSTRLVPESSIPALAQRSSPDYGIERRRMHAFPVLSTKHRVSVYTPIIMLLYILATSHTFKRLDTVTCYPRAFWPDKCLMTGELLYVRDWSVDTPRNTPCLI